MNHSMAVMSIMELRQNNLLFEIELEQGQAMSMQSHYPPTVQVD